MTQPTPESPWALVCFNVFAFGIKQENNTSPLCPKSQDFTWTVAHCEQNRPPIRSFAVAHYAILGKAENGTALQSLNSAAYQTKEILFCYTQKRIMQKRGCRRCLCPIYCPIINITVIFILKRPLSSLSAAPPPFVVHPHRSDSFVYTKATHKTYSKKLKATQNQKKKNKNLEQESERTKNNCLSSDGN